MDSLLYQKVHGCLAGATAGARADAGEATLAGLPALAAKAMLATGGALSADSFADFLIENVTEAQAEQFSPALKFSFFKLFYTLKTARDIGLGNIQDATSAVLAAPVGMLHPADPQTAMFDGYDIATTIHWGPGRDAAGALAAAVAVAMAQAGSPRAIADAALAYIPGRRRSLLHAPMLLALELAEKADSPGAFRKAWLAEADRFALADSQPEQNPLLVAPAAVGLFLLTAGAPEAALDEAAAFGLPGVASLCGTLLGAWLGAAGLPAAWDALAESAETAAAITGLIQKNTGTALETQQALLALDGRAG